MGVLGKENLESTLSSGSPGLKISRSQQLGIIDTSFFGIPVHRTPSAIPGERATIMTCVLICDFFKPP